LVGLSAAFAGDAIEEKPAAALSTVINERMKRALIFFLAKLKSHSTSFSVHQSLDADCSCSVANLN